MRPEHLVEHKLIQIADIEDLMLLDVNQPLKEDEDFMTVSKG